MIFQKVILRVLLAVCAWSSAACGKKESRSLSQAEIQDRILEGKRHLSSFEGAAARDAFRSVEGDAKKVSSQSYCEAMYGVVLADIQIALAKVNPALLHFLAEQLRGADASATPDASLIELWEDVEPTVRELAQYSAAVTEIVDCRFSIGLSEPRDPADAEYRFVARFLDNERPVAELALQSRFDGVEARLIGALAQATLGIANLVFAHDLTWTLDAGKAAHQLGVSESCIEGGFLLCALGEADPGHPPIHLLDWAFVLADNPRLLAAHPDRWKQRISSVAPDMAPAIFPLRTVFDAMVDRSDRILRDEEDEDEAEAYAVVYQDVNGNGAMDTTDTLGLNVHDIELRCDALIGVLVDEVDAEACREQFATYQEVAAAGLLFVRSAAAPSEAIIAELERFLDRLYAALAAVGDPDISYEPLPFNSFSGLFTDLFPVFDRPAPNFVTFDLPAYFRAPRPIRDFLPKWQSTAAVTGSRFLADADDYAYLPDTTQTITAVDAYLDEKYGGLLWGLLGADKILTFDPASATDRALFGCPGENCVPADCLHAGNLYSEMNGLPIVGASEIWRWPVLYLAFPDPTFGGILRMNEPAWATRLTETGNGAWSGLACTLAPEGSAATNLSLQRSFWLFSDFFLDHFALAGVLGAGFDF